MLCGRDEGLASVRARENGRALFQEVHAHLHPTYSTLNSQDFTGGSRRLSTKSY